MQFVPVWVKNICRIQVDVKEMETIEFPKFEYARYVTFKCVPYFGMCGLLRGLLPDIQTPQNKIQNNLLKTISAQSSKGTVGGQMLKIKDMAVTAKSWSLLGLCTGPIIAMILMYGLRMSEIYKMCYTLRHDQAQIRRERWSIIGGLSGGTVGLIASLPLNVKYVGTLGVVAGISIGCLSSTAYSFVIGDDDADDEEKNSSTLSSATD